MKCSSPGCENNATMRARVLGRLDRPVCDACATDLQRRYARVINLKLLEPPPAAPPELLTHGDYGVAVAQLAEIGRALCDDLPDLPRLIASLRHHRSSLGSAATVIDVGPLLELAEALQPVAKLAIRLSRKQLADAGLSVEDKTGGMC